jgi:hypothetical protein
MFSEAPKKLSKNIAIHCYCCESRLADYLCRFKMGELSIQVCLCPDCMNRDTAYLFENTIGLPYTENSCTHPC